MGFGDLVFTSTLNTSTPKVDFPKKQKGKGVAKRKKVIQVDLEDSPNLEGKSEISVLAKDFPYPKFMDKELMIPALFEQLWGDDDGLTDKFQRASRVVEVSSVTQALGVGNPFRCLTYPGSQRLGGENNSSLEWEAGPGEG